MKQDETRPLFSALRASHRSLASCPGYTDSHGAWNTGFQCPKWGGKDEEYCCGDSNKRFCCSAPPKPRHHSHNDGGRKDGGDDVDVDRNKGGRGRGGGDRKEDRSHAGRNRGDDDRGNRNNKKEKFNFLLNNSQADVIDRRPITDELIRSGLVASSPSGIGQVTHSINYKAHNSNVQFPVIPIVLALAVASCVFMVVSVLVCCCYCSCCAVKKRRNRKKDKNNYVKTTSVNLEAEVTSAAIAAQALVIMPGSDSFCTTNNTTNNIYNNNASNISNNTLSTTSSMSAMYNNISCRGPPSMQVPRESPAMTNNSSETPNDTIHPKLHHPHLDPYPHQPIPLDPHTPIINTRDQTLHWKELENLLSSHEKSRLNEKNTMNELSTSITNWLPLSKGQLGGKESCVNQWVSENTHQLNHANDNNNVCNSHNNICISNSNSLHNGHINSMNTNIHSMNTNIHSMNNSINNNVNRNIQHSFANNNLKGNIADFNNTINCSVSFHGNHACANNQSPVAISPFPDVTQTSTFNPGGANKSPSNNSNKINNNTDKINNNSFNNNNTSINNNSLKLNENLGSNSPYKQHKDQQTHTRAHTEAPIQADIDIDGFSSKPSLPDIPDCPQLKLASTWMAMR